MAHGGKRIGAGRPPGASFAQLVSTAEKKKFVEFVLDQYMGDIRLAIWMGDHLFPKPQPDMGDFNGVPFIFMPLELMEKHQLKNAAHPRSKPNSK